MGPYFLEFPNCFCCALVILGSAAILVLRVISVFPKIRGTFLGGPWNQDHSILGSILGHPYSGKIPIAAVIGIVTAVSLLLIIVHTPVMVCVVILLGLVFHPGH